MSPPTTGGLGAALRERLLDRLRLVERAQALETHPRAAHGGDRRGEAEAVLRACLRALGDRDGYRLAARTLAGEVVTAGGVEEWTALQELSQAGLVSWDIGTGRVEPTPLLRELHGILASAVDEAGR